MSEETNKAKAVSSATDVMKVTMALATGTLVFSAELLKEDVSIGLTAKVFLVASWCFLCTSIIAGALSYMRVPVMISEDNLDIHDKLFSSPGRIHHLSFLVGVIVLGITMILILIGK